MGNMVAGVLDGGMSIVVVAVDMTQSFADRDEMMMEGIRDRETDGAWSAGSESGAFPQKHLLIWLGTQLSYDHAGSLGTVVAFPPLNCPICS